MPNKIHILLAVLVLLAVLLAGCSMLEQVPAPPAGVTDQAQSGLPVETEPGLQPDSPTESGNNTGEEPAQPSSINLPVVGVSEPSPTPDPENVGSGQNIPVEGEQDSQSGGGQLVEAQVFIDSVEVEIQQGDLPRVLLRVRGNLPTPCHQFASQPEQPDTEGRINVRLFSLVDPEAVCAATLQPFEQVVDLGLFPPGSYILLVNGEVLQELTF